MATPKEVGAEDIFNSYMERVRVIAWIKHTTFELLADLAGRI